MNRVTRKSVFGVSRSYIKRTVRPQKMARDIGSGKIERAGANQLAADMRLCFMHMQKNNSFL